MARITSNQSCPGQAAPARGGRAGGRRHARPRGLRRRRRRVRAAARTRDTGGGGSKTLTVGGAKFTEALILEQLYGQLLTKAGYTIDYKTADNREIYAKSLESGEIDVVPEYAATMAEYLNRQKNGPDAAAVSSADATATVEALKPLAEAQGLAVFEPSRRPPTRTASRSRRRSPTPTRSRRSSQLAAFKKAIKLAADEECGNPERVFCKPGLEKTYGFQITVDPLGFGSTTGKQAVLAGKDDVALTGTTDGTLEQLGLVLLEDDKKLQSADNVIPVVNKESAGDAGGRGRARQAVRRPHDRGPRRSSTCRWTASARSPRTSPRST